MGHVPTRLPGVQFGGTFPKLADRANKIAIARSFGTGDGGHNHTPIVTGRSPLRAPMGAIVSRGMGSMNPRTGMPTNVLVMPESIRGDLQLGTPTGPFTYTSVQNAFVPAGSLGGNYDRGRGRYSDPGVRCCTGLFRDAYADAQHVAIACLPGSVPTPATVSICNANGICSNGKPTDRLVVARS